ncbi:MAG: hypothetical protein QNL04_10685 [SAR324 cluster bacterium]|nr:hypothetical protein [SAR324 cluster bacterium]
MEPRKCQVIFDSSLSEEEVEIRINAIRLIAGVHHVATEQTNTKVPKREREEQEFHSGAPAPNRTREEETVWETEQDVSPQRLAIDTAIKWGVRSKMVTLAHIQSLDSAALVHLAMQLLEKMPEEEKTKLGSDISDMMT